MPKISFEPSVEVACHPYFDDKHRHMITTEPMLYSASLDFALEKGGPLTKSLLTHITFLAEWGSDVGTMSRMGYHPVIDTKKVLLQKGQYPCIPGWHCDGVPRADNNSQPDITKLSEPIVHYTATFSNLPQNLHSGTQFINSYQEVMVNPERVWGSVNKELENIHGSHIFQTPADGTVYRFTRGQLHRGPQCQNPEWRFFFRLSFYHMPAMNKIREQVQVYADPNNGW